MIAVKISLMTMNKVWLLRRIDYVRNDDQLTTIAPATV